ncbi:MAG: SDR family NAD(P)-dependent oxidoreductase [Chitinophagales bacterium]|nr:SDR family NAD(P)-dependent oxidoreductase [Chitinophagales bacterium]
MSKKQIFVTGATSGIGKETALQLADKGHDISIIARNEFKCKAVVDELQSRNRDGNFNYYIADFTDLASVQKTAKQIASNTEHIDVLINNAGAVYDKRILSADGYEMTLVSNHLAPFVLTHHLMPTILKSNWGKVITVASDSHFKGTMDFNDLHFEKNYFIMKAYERSKLANVLFTIELAKIYADRNFSSYAVQPGHVKSDIGAKTSSGLVHFAWNTYNSIFGIPTAEGAWTSVYLADDNGVNNLSGKYWDLKQPKPVSKIAQDEQLAKDFWNLSTEMTKQYLD